MTMVEREMMRVRSAMIEASGPERERLWGAQQALAWASDPEVFASPMSVLSARTPADGEGCPSPKSLPLS
jgi:hypothetical protein